MSYVSGTRKQYGYLGGTRVAEVYQPSAARFTSSDNVLSRGADLTGNADSKQMTVAFWFKKDDIGNARNILGNEVSGEGEEAGAVYALTVNTDDRIIFQASDTEGNTFQVKSTVLEDTDSWHHFMMSIDTDDMGKTKLFLDGANALASYDDFLTGGEANKTPLTIVFTGIDHHIGGIEAEGEPDTNFFRGCLADFWFGPGQYTADIDAFLISAGVPRSLGASGESPTGTAPLVFLNDPRATWGTNKGTGGNFSFTTTPAACGVAAPITPKEWIVGSRAENAYISGQRTGGA